MKRESTKEISNNSKIDFFAWYEFRSNHVYVNLHELFSIVCKFSTVISKYVGT